MEGENLARETDEEGHFRKRMLFVFGWKWGCKLELVLVETETEMAVFMEAIDASYSQIGRAHV